MMYEPLANPKFHFKTDQERISMIALKMHEMVLLPTSCFKHHPITTIILVAQSQACRRVVS